MLDQLPIPLLPGDHLIYGLKSFFDISGRITSLRTWGPGIHIEVYIGNSQSVASRNGLGVNLYPLRTLSLIAVLRPVAKWDLDSMLAWFNQPYDWQRNSGVKDRPYGWLDLLAFVNINLKTQGWICSEFAAYADKAAGCEMFNTEFFYGAIDPNNFFLAEGLRHEWIKPGVSKLLLKSLVLK